MDFTLRFRWRVRLVERELGFVFERTPLGLGMDAMCEREVEVCREDVVGSK